MYISENIHVFSLIVQKKTKLLYMKIVKCILNQYISLLSKERRILKQKQKPNTIYTNSTKHSVQCGFKLK